MTPSTDGVRVVPVEGVPEIREGDDLADILAERLRPLGVRDGDVVVVTQKVVSKAEGRIVPDAERDAVIAAETVRVVARRGDLVIAETRHGFVCANAGVDASNLEPGTLALLPDDPDRSADAIRAGLSAALGVERLGVVVTDTFGRPWREGLVNVAIGVAGIPALLDLRGTRDRHGRLLEATIVAVADEVAAASGLVTGKADGVPAALVRGVRADGVAGTARELIRASTDDLFRESPLQALHARRTIRAFGPGDVPTDAIADAVAAACTAPAPHHTRPWRFTVLTSQPAKRALLAAMAEAWRADLRRDGTPEHVIARRIAKSDAVLGAAPALIVPWVTFDGAHRYDDAERATAERTMFLLSGGAAIQTLLLALHARGVASCWISSTLFCQEETRATLDVDDGWTALGTVACGPMPEGGAPRPRPPIDPWSFSDLR
ncbi:MAG TPA: coenzyme F420-0:L-glutamate ligase [Actinomycetota bacterium]|nr:coenzyme F420-0:L-glutamate ligase [Actinomycetota bacterium]